MKNNHFLLALLVTVVGCSKASSPIATSPGTITITKVDTVASYPGHVRTPSDNNARVNVSGTVFYLTDSVTRQKVTNENGVLSYQDAAKIAVIAGKFTDTFEYEPGFYEQLNYKEYPHTVSTTTVILK